MLTWMKENQKKKEGRWNSECGKIWYWRLSSLSSLTSGLHTTFLLRRLFLHRFWLAIETLATSIQHFPVCFLLFWKWWRSKGVWWLHKVLQNHGNHKPCLSFPVFWKSLHIVCTYWEARSDSWDPSGYFAYVKHNPDSWFIITIAVSIKSDCLFLPFFKVKD